MNLLAVLLCGIAFMLIGMLWYSPKLFGVQWMKLVGLSDEDIEESKSEMPKIYGISFLTSLLAAYILNLILQISGITTVDHIIILVLVLWATFTFIPALVNSLYSQRPTKLVMIDAGYFLVSYLVFALIFYAVLYTDRPTIPPQENIDEVPSEVVIPENTELGNKVTLEGTIRPGAEIDREYCAEGLYIVTETDTLLMRDLVSGMYADPTFVNKDVIVEGIMPNDIAMCMALACDCEPFVVATQVTLNQ